LFFFLLRKHNKGRGTPTVDVHKHMPPLRGFLFRLHKYYQSNPSLLKLKAKGALRVPSKHVVRRTTATATHIWHEGNV
jgi:hypothetical protein